jgi:hypothetical protein
VDRCDKLVDVAVGSVIQFRNESADVTLADVNTGSPAFQAVMDPYLDRTRATSDRVAELGCETEVLSDDFHRRLFGLIPQTEGGLTAIEIANQLHPFGGGLLPAE